MRIGIYTRSEDLRLPSLQWLDSNGFDSFEIYKEDVVDENEDLCHREQLNMLIYDIEMIHLDAVYVEVFKIISPVTVKVLQFLIEIQKLNVPIYFSSGKIEPSDESITHFHNLFISQWEKFKRESANINFDQTIESKNQSNQPL